MSKILLFFVVFLSYKLIYASDDGFTSSPDHSESSTFSGSQTRSPEIVLQEDRSIEDIHHTFRYATCPEFSYQHPKIIENLVSIAKREDVDDEEKARVFYLLHIGVKGIAYNCGDDQEKEHALREKSDQFLFESQRLSRLSEKDFKIKINEWCRQYISNPDDAKEELRTLSALSATENWIELKKRYDKLNVKYVDKAIDLAKAAIRGDITADPATYMSFANSQYRAEGCMEIADHLAQLYYKSKYSERDTDQNNKILEISKKLYNGALMKFNDIRGYQGFIKLSAESDITEEMNTRNRELIAEQQKLMDSINSLL